MESGDDKEIVEPKSLVVGACIRCGRFGHTAEECMDPIICSRCKKEGHVPRVYTEVMPWECIAPFCGFVASGQGFHLIQDNDYGERSSRQGFHLTQHDEYGEGNRNMAKCALITITKGTVTARQLESEFRAQAGPQSIWRWYAKKIADKMFQMRFPTVEKVQDFSFFVGIKMTTVSEVTFKVEQWNPHAGAKAKLETAWFRILGIPLEKRTEKIESYIASLVGVPLEVDKNNLKTWDYVRIKIGCRDVTKVPQQWKAY